MPTAMRTDIVNQVTAVASSNPALRVRVAVYLIISSSGYKVIS